MHIIPALLVAAVVSQIALLTTTVYLHRVLAHRALRLNSRVALVFRVVIWVTTGIVPRAWVAVHRRHHAFADTDLDPHSPVVLGFWRVQLGNVQLYRRTVNDGVTVTRYSRDLPPDRLDRALLDHALPGLATGLGLLTVFLGWPTALAAGGLHALAYLGVSAAVNAVGHSFGKRPHANAATNNQWLAWVSGGEGLHNNHHAAPTAARFAFTRRQFDPGWWIVRSLVRAHLATVRHDDVKARAPRRPSARQTV